MIGSGYERRRNHQQHSSTGHDDAAAPRVRIYELAKELALGHREMVAKVRSLGIEVANHMSHLEPADVDRVRRAVDAERKESHVEERLNDTVIRRRSKSARAAAGAPGPAAAAVGAPGAAAGRSRARAAPRSRARAGSRRQRRSSTSRRRPRTTRRGCAPVEAAPLRREPSEARRRR